MARNNSSITLRQKREVSGQSISLKAIQNKRRVITNLLTGVISNTTAEWLPAADGPSESRPQPTRITTEHRLSLPSSGPAMVAGNSTIKSHHVRSGSQRSHCTVADQPKATKTQSPSSENNDSAPDFTHEWMAEFCVEPPNDAETCALGTFVPCALMGKIDWRLSQIEARGDPLDSAWKPSYGCNTTCWALALSTLLGEPTGFIVMPIYAMLQRQRVRNTYDIHTDSCNDCALAWFCTRCSIIQVDREIRAREGEARLRTNTKFILEPVLTQPTRVEPMRYISPRPVLERQVTVEDLRASKEKGWITQVALLKRQAALSRLDSEDMASPSNDVAHKLDSQPEQADLPSKEADSTLDNVNSPQEKVEILLEKLNSPSSKVDSPLEKSESCLERASSSLREVDSRPETALRDKSNQTIERTKYPTLKVTAHEKDPSNETTMITVLRRVSRELKSSLSARPKNAGSSVNEAETDNNFSKRDSKVREDPKIRDEHSLLDCEITTPLEYETQEQNLPSSGSKMTISPQQNQEHNLVDCDTITARSSVAVPVHDLANCSTASIKLSMATPVHDLVNCSVGSARSSIAIDEHILTNCQKVSSIPNSSKLNHRMSSCASDPASYIHDFTDYPIKKRVLEYYEKNPTMSIYSRARRRLSSYMTTASEHSEPPIGTHTQELSYVHDFTDCPINKAVLEYYEKEEKRAQGRPSIPDQEYGYGYRLSSCPAIEDITQRASAKVQRSDSCCSMVAEIRRQRSRQHRVVSCPGATVSTDKGASRQHRVDSCPILLSLGQISHRPSLKIPMDCRALPSIPSFEESKAAINKGKGKECEIEHIHTDECLSDGVYQCSENGNPRRNSFNYAIDIITTAVKSFQFKPEDAEEGSNIKKETPQKRRNKKRKGKSVELKVNQSPKPKEDSAQAALERLLLASTSQGAKKGPAVKIDIEQKCHTVTILADVSRDGQADEGAENSKPEKRAKTWGDTLGKIFGEARNSEIGS